MGFLESGTKMVRQDALNWIIELKEIQNIQWNQCCAFFPTRLYVCTSRGFGPSWLLAVFPVFSQSKQPKEKVLLFTLPKRTILRWLRHEPMDSGPRPTGQTFLMAFAMNKGNEDPIFILDRLERGCLSRFHRNMQCLVTNQHFTFFC